MKRNTSLTHLFRNGISMLFGILLLSVSLSSCLDEPMVDNPGRSDQGVKIYLRIPAQSISQTRAGSAIDDKYVDPTSVYVFVLSGDGTNTDHKVLQVVNAVAGTESMFYAKLAESREARYVYVVANAKEEIEPLLETLPGMSVSVLQSKLKKTVTLTSEVISQAISRQPMFGELELKDGITPETTIGIPTDPVKLTRITSKITIANKTNNIHFTLLGANLVNAPQLGYIVPEQTPTGVNRYPTGAEGDINEMLSTPTKGNETETVLYSFESDKKTDNSTFVIIKAKYLGKPYYYRLNLNNKEVDYPLLRNHHYMVDILKVDKVGYDNAEEATKNSASNIEYVINVIDETGRNMVSNGEYYLAVSQTEFYYYTEEDEEFGTQEVAVVTHNAPTSVLRSCVTTPTGVGISGFPETDESFPLTVTMPKDIIEATITLTLGNLTREIKVYHKKVKNIHFGTTLDYFSKKGYIAGKVDTKDESFLKLGRTVNAPDNELSSSLEDEGGNVYIRLDGYLGVNEAATRNLAVDLFRNDASGNARVVFKQEMYNIYKDIVDQAKLSPYTYVGTFHRWNETGERLISIHAENLNAGTIKPGDNIEWKAFIVVGDFIRLSDKWSNDTHVATHDPYGKGYTTNLESDYNIETQGQIASGDQKTELSKTGPIFFRVGLTSKLSKSSKPRYGLIAVVVNPNSNPITRYIYVRQGEEPDYLMRKEDLMGGTSVITGARDYATKFSPYNLTDPDGKEFSQPGLVGESTDFVEFPSQAGYLYEAVYCPKKENPWDQDAFKKGRGWRDNNGTTEGSNNTYSGNWITDFEICPTGYHHPRGNTSDEASEDGSVSKSSVRQSLWLYPQDKTDSQTQNFIIGYLADGYYDRRPMGGELDENISGRSTNNQPTYVSEGATRAYIGALAFNPYSSASLFLPFSGTRQGRILSKAGRNGSFWTSTKQNSKTFWSVAYGLLPDPSNQGNQFDIFRADNYNTDTNRALSVRCVKD